MICWYINRPPILIVSPRILSEITVLKKPEKIEFLQSMLDSKLGLFEVTGTDLMEGYAYIKDVFTGVEYTIIDIGLSGQPNFEDFYFYTRIISYHGINFGTGLNLIFTKLVTNNPTKARTRK
jgi:hypothetical protein